MEYSAIRAFIQYLLGAEGDYPDDRGIYRNPGSPKWSVQITLLVWPMVYICHSTSISSNAANWIGDETADPSDKR
jgi:hypothetical protein